MYVFNWDCRDLPSLSIARDLRSTKRQRRSEHWVRYYLFVLSNPIYTNAIADILHGHVDFTALFDGQYVYIMERNPCHFSAHLAHPNKYETLSAQGFQPAATDANGTTTVRAQS